MAQSIENLASPDDTIAACLNWATRRIRETSPSARLDAELILCFVLGVPRIKLISERDSVPSEDARLKFIELIERREKGEPVAYLTGRKEFYGYEFKVSPAVLIPRPETELLVAEALKVALPATEPVKILDLGTGSGCIIIALALELKHRGIKCAAYAVDQSEPALEVARANAAELDISEAITFINGDWFNALPEGKFHVIVSNPPYVASHDPRVSREVSYEPSAAVYAGAKGDEALKILLTEAPKYLLNGGYLCLEIGSDQSEFVSEFIPQTPFGKTPLTILSDLAGLPRVVKIGPYRGV